MKYIIGIRKVTNDPNRIASPAKISPIPRYIGCRLIEKGPVVISVFGILLGFTVVLNLLKRESVHKLMITPIITGTTPIRFNGEMNNFGVEKNVQRIIFAIASI